jgi:tRNA A-37 threonylcarbamoyl transferase component Bud32
MSQPGIRVLGGRYRLTHRVGRGGMGAVWQAHDELLGREVAVKEILLPQGLDEEQLAATRGRALREARAAARVRHPAVVTIHDVVIEDDHPWIVMDYVRARSLDERLRDGGALPVTEVARIGEALIGALEAIHAQGIVHRDLKPANVLMEEDGHVVLTDFGIATIEGDARLTASGLLIGTPGYMAPERLAGRPGGPASDLWSLGAVLYTAVEGRLPYEGNTPMVIASAVLTRDPAEQRRSGPLGPVITGLLARDPADRMDARTAADRLAALTRDRAPDLSARSRAPLPPNDDQTRRYPPGEITESAPATRPAETAKTAETARGAQLGPVPGWLREPAFGAAGTRPAGRASLRPTWTRSPARVAGTVAAVAVIGLVVWLVTTAPFGDGGGTDLGATARPTPDPCTLLSPAQLTTLVQGAKATSMPDFGEGAECVWRSAEPSGGTVLTIDLASFTKEAGASTALADRQNKTSVGSSLAISGIGNEVFAHEDRANGEVDVLFRRGRNVVVVRYDDVEEEKAQRCAFQAARWADAALGRFGR